MNPSLTSSDPRVAIFRGHPVYSETAPFHPDECFPEYPFANVLGPRNVSYAGVRTVLQLLGMDAANFGTADWNPLGELIRPGDRVVLKPNFIAHSHAVRRHEWRHIITHPSVLRAVLDYVFIALRGSGEVTIADGPQTDSDFDAIRERASLDELCAFFRRRGLAIKVIDLRAERWYQVDGITEKRVRLGGDPQGYARIDLGDKSEFGKYRLSGRFYGADYDTSETAQFHVNGHHTYVVSRTALDADVLINLPKLKTHKKTGVTLSLKNLVGIIGHRNCLPHHTIGMPDAGGDEVPSRNLRNTVQAKVVKAFREHLTRSGGCGGPFARLVIKCGRPVFGDPARVIRSGNWHGNDTAWRMSLDVNKTLFHFTGSARPRTTPLRYFTLIDGIVGSDGNGPVMGDEKLSGLVIGGFNPVAVDTVSAELMGFDPEKLALLKHAWETRDYPLVEYGPGEVVCKSNVSDWNGGLDDLSRAKHLEFRPPVGWLRHIERDIPCEVFSR